MALWCPPKGGADLTLISLPLTLQVLEIQEAGLYPVPELGAPSVLFGQELPFGIQPVAFLITSAIAVFLTLLFSYLLFLTATN